MAYIDKEDGKIRKFEGNPHHPASRGRNCAKGPATINQVKDTERILYPQKRVGERGEGKWETISWEQALDEIAAKIQKSLKAEFHGLTPETTRVEILAALVKGLCRYQREHLKLIGIDVSLNDSICVTGGALSPSLIKAKKKWLRKCDYIYEEQSSLRGAALLGKKHLEQNE